MTYRPKTPTSHARPVQVESAVGGICGARTPDGHGVLLWPRAGGAFCAVVDSPERFLVDNSVSTVRTVLATGSGVRDTSVFTVGAGLYALVMARIGGIQTMRLYVANDANDPTSWSIRSTIQSVTEAGTVFSLPKSAGIPLVLPSGRWVLFCPGWRDEGDGTAARSWVSDDAGVSWTAGLNYAHTSTGLPFTEFVSAQTHQATSGLYGVSGSDAGGVAVGLALWRSTDSGTSWSMVDTGAYNTQPRLTAFAGDLYAMVAQRVYSATSPGTFAGWSDTGQQWVPAGDDADAQERERTRKAVSIGGSVFFFWTDRVARTLGGWSVGFIGAI